MRQPKPFFRKFTATWYVQLGRKQINLGKDKKAAFRRYHELMADRGTASDQLSKVAEVFEEYLEWLHTHRSEGTYQQAVHYLSLFARHIGPGAKVRELTGMLVTRWIEKQGSWSPTTQHDAVALVQRAFRWAVRRGLIRQSPVEHVEGKPRRKRREVVYTPEQWKQLKAEVKDDDFSDLLDFMWLTGCRPQEARTVEARHVDLTNAIVVFPPSESKGQKSERVLFLPDAAIAICRRRLEASPDGLVFQNTNGRPWTKDSMNCRFRRLREKLNFPVCAYGIRHSYATEALKRGVDSLTLAQIMGHKEDTSMLSRHYAHLAKNTVYLRETAQRLANSEICSPR